MDPPSGLSSRFGLRVVRRMPPARESMAWQVWCQSGQGVLRRLDPDRFPPAHDQTCASLEWLHRFLARLATRGVCAPEPIGAFDGASWICRDGAIWELVSYLPGRIIGWSRRPSLVGVGVLLARYHQAVGDIDPGGQRPLAFPVASLHQGKTSGLVRGWVDDLGEDLDRIGHDQAPQLVIHGDFTCHNVLVPNTGPRMPTGVIDFALAYREAQLADLGFGLWRSGRPCQDAIGLDSTRVDDFVTGYTRVQALASPAAEAISVYIRARGVQQAVKAESRGARLHPLLAERIVWLHDHQAQVRDSIDAAIKATRRRGPLPRELPGRY